MPLMVELLWDTVCTLPGLRILSGDQLAAALFCGIDTYFLKDFIIGVAEIDFLEFYAAQLLEMIFDALLLALQD